MGGCGGSGPFVVGISISELDCGYHSEAGGHGEKSVTGTAEESRKYKKETVTLPKTFSKLALQYLKKYDIACIKCCIGWSIAIIQ